MHIEDNSMFFLTNNQESNFELLQYGKIGSKKHLYEKKHTNGLIIECIVRQRMYRKSAICMREKSKMDITWPFLNGYLSEIRFTSILSL